MPRGVSLGGGEVVEQGVIFTGDVSDVLAKMDQMAAASSRATQAVTSGWAAAAKSIQSSQMVSQLETVSALFIQVGGSVSRAASLITSSIRPVATVGSVLQSVGGSAGFAAAGIAGLVGTAAAAAGGAAFLASAASSAVDELEKLHQEVDPAARAQIVAYRAAHRDLTVALDKLKVAVGSGLAEDIGTIVEAAAGGVASFTRWYQSTEGARNALAGLRDEVSNFVSFGLFGQVTQGLDDLAGAAEDAKVSVDGLTSADIFGGSAKEQAALRAHELANQAKAARESAQEMAKLRQADQQLVQEQAARIAATSQLDDITARLNRTLLGDKEQILSDYDEQIDRIVTLGEKSHDLDAANAAAAAAEQARDRKLHDLAVQHQRDIEAATRAWDDLITTTQRSAEDATTAIKGMLREMSRESSEAQLQLGTDAAQTTAGILGNLATVQGGIVDSYEARRQAGETFSQAEAAAGNAAIERQKYLSLAQAGISATLAGIGTYTALVAELVPPPAAAIAGGLVTAASYAAAASGIRAGTPAFFTYPAPSDTSYNGGGLVDTNGDGSGDTPGAIAGKGGSVQRPGGGDVGSGSTSRSSRGSSVARGQRITVTVEGRTGKSRRGGPR